RLAEFFATGRAPERLGSACANAVPHQAFRCQDGKYVAVGVLRDADWPRFCAALDLPDLAVDDRLATNAGRVAARAGLVPRLEDAFARRPAAWWLLHLNRACLPAGPFLDFEALRHHPQVLANGYIQEIDTPWGATLVPGPPWRFAGDALPVRTCPVP